MTEEVLMEFSEGPYQVLNYKVFYKDGKVYIDANQGDFGRLPIEDLDTIESLREALDKAEGHLKEHERRKEEL